MPIKTITRRTEFGGAGLPTIGTLRKGAPKPQKGLGKDLDWLRLDSPYEAVTGVYHHLYGEEPKQIPNVFLVGDTLSQAFTHYMEHWTKGGLKIRCDGETIVKQDGQRTQAACLSQTDKGCQCKPKGYLAFRIPALEQASGQFGTIRMTIGAWNEIPAIVQTLSDLQEQGLKLSQVPFVLKREPRKIKNPTNGAMMTKSLVYLLPMLPQQIAVVNADDDPLDIDPESGEILDEVNDYDQDEHYTVDESTWHLVEMHRFVDKGDTKNILHCVINEDENAYAHPRSDVYHLLTTLINDSANMVYIKVDAGKIIVDARAEEAPF